MAFNAPVLTLTLPAAVTAGIAASQSGTAGTPLTLSGSLVTAGVANLVVPRRVIITSGGNDSGITFAIVGTDRYGRPQTEVLTGANIGAAQTTHDFLTVTSETPSGNTAGTVTSGTNAVGSTAPYIVDTFINSANYGAALEVTGTVTTTLEGSMTDLTPSWDLANNSPVWYPIAGWQNVTTNQQNTVTGPFTMIRLTNSSGTGTAKARLVVPFLAGA